MKSLSNGYVPAARAVLAMAIVGLLASMASAETADELIAKNIKAQGGKDALLNLKSIERKGTVNVDGTFGQLEGSVEEVAIPWKKARRALDLGVFVQKEGYNGKTAWRDGMMGISELEGEEANQIKQAVELNPFIKMAEHGTKAEKLDDETVDGVAYNVVQSTPKDRPAIKFFLDKESNQIKRMTLTQNNPQFGKIDVVVENLDFEQFGPVKLPTKTKVTIGEAMTIETKFTETKVNGDVDEAVFEMPKDPAK